MKLSNDRLFPLALGAGIVWAILGGVLVALSSLEKTQEERNLYRILNWSYGGGSIAIAFGVVFWLAREIMRNDRVLKELEAQLSSARGQA